VRSAVLLIMVWLAGVGAWAQAHNPIALHCGVQPTARARGCAFLADTINPTSVLGPAASALLYQSLFRPSDWGPGAAGFGYKFGTNMADRTSYIFFRRFLFASAFHTDGEYKLQTHKAFKQRVRYILRQPFVGIKDRDGNETVNLPVLLGCTASAVLSNAYYPDQQRTTGKAFAHTGESVATYMGINAAHEFVPAVLRATWNKIKSKSPIGRKQKERP
jgi:hypothetical protein